MILRDYQLEMIQDVKKSWQKGKKRPCIVAPCGSGKTVIASELAKNTTDKGNSVIFLVHRKELCDQTYATFKDYGVNMDLCRIGMVQTLTRRDFLEPKLIIVDENHHVLSKSYTNILNKFPNSYCVGLTATPTRLNGSGLGKVNDDLIIGPSVAELIKQYCLAPFKYFSHVSVNTATLEVKHGEFVQSDIDNLMSQKYIFGDAIDNYRKYSCKKTIVYCSSIANSRETAEAFKNAGIPAVHLDGETPKNKRGEIINDFRSGKIFVLCNVDLLSEGFDVPDCDSCILLRPTMSLTLHIQQSMRPMRYLPNKTAIIIDQVENYTRHGIPDTPHEWSLDFKKNNQVEKAASIRVCENCFSVYDMKTLFCENCFRGNQYWDMRQAKCRGKNCDEFGKAQQFGFGECCSCEGKLERNNRIERETVKCELKEIKNFKINSWKDCKPLEELIKIQNTRGYEKGWVFFRAKDLRLINTVDDLKYIQKALGYRRGWYIHRAEELGIVI